MILQGEPRVLSLETGRWPWGNVTLKIPIPENGESSIGKRFSRQAGPQLRRNSLTRRTRSLVAGVTSFRTAELKLNKREALNDALYAVEALRIALELKTRAA